MSDSSSTPSHIIKNITIGVITSVLAALLIYYTIGNPAKAEFSKKKAATKKAWTSYKENRAVFVEALKTMDTAMDDNRAKKLLHHYLDISIDNMENIKKETDADQRIFSTIDITVAQVKEMKPLFDNYFTERENFIRNNPDVFIDNPTLVKLEKKMLEDMAILQTRDTLRLNTFRNGLIKDYGVE